VSQAPDGWHVDVSVTWRGHPLCQYAGVLGLV
jgi:hypothetical protein